MADDNNDNIRDLVAEVAAAYFANSHVGVGEIPAVIDQIAKSLGGVGVVAESAPAAAEPPAAKKLTPAQIRKSITPDAIVSFEDGKPYKTLRRHLSVKGLTPDQYREKWGLPKDYPMVSPNYSAARSQMARAIGLGAKGGRRGPSRAAAPSRRKRAEPAAE
jgi:predicted transcriptional regulator